MPSIAAHLVVAKLVGEKISVDKKEFYKGCILPDLVRGADTHFTKKGTYYLIPDIDKYKHCVDYHRDINKGYLCHLLLDKYFLEDYIINNIKDYNKIDLFTKDMMYNDYTNMNYLLVRRYILDIEFINMIMDDLDNVDNIKSEYNKMCINHKDIRKLKIIDYNKFCMFLENIIDIIVEDLR